MGREAWMLGNEEIKAKVLLGLAFWVRRFQFIMEFITMKQMLSNQRIYVNLKNEGKLDPLRVYICLSFFKLLKLYLLTHINILIHN